MVAGFDLKDELLEVGTNGGLKEGELLVVEGLVDEGGLMLVG